MNNKVQRISSIDALRGFVVFIMIFVNDLAIIHGQIVPNWLLHYSDRAKGSGMTLVDVVLPGFLFIVGMSIPFAMQHKTSIFNFLTHVIFRTFSLLFLGVMMVYNWPSTDLMGWSGVLWRTMMGVCALLAFCQIKNFKFMTFLNVSGWLGLFVLAFEFVGKQGQHIITYPPLHIYPSWWGILGIIGWAYFIASIIYLIFNNNRTGLLGSFVLLMCLFPAEKIGILKGISLGNYINIGATLGVQPAIAVAGVLLSTVIRQINAQRILFVLWFILGMVSAAILLTGLYGISKNQATPSWALYSCAIMATLWLFFDRLGEGKLKRFFSLAGQNVFLTYILSAIYFSFLINLGFGDIYQHFAEIGLVFALIRALSVSLILIMMTLIFNRLGFRLVL